MQSFIIGRVTADLTLKTATNGNIYVRFNIAERIGYSQRYQFPQVWAWGGDARRLIKANIKQGSLIWVSGLLELEDYSKQDGTKDKRLKIKLDNWGYVPSSNAKNGNAEADTLSDDELETGTLPLMFPIGEIDGDREDLPD